VKIVVDRDKCTGHARCYATAPQIYTLDEEGYNSLDSLDVPTEHEAAAREGAEACPEGAISIVD
jgi:ferredoxin